MRIAGIERPGAHGTTSKLNAAARKTGIAAPRLRNIYGRRARRIEAHEFDRLRKATGLWPGQEAVTALLSGLVGQIDGFLAALGGRS